MDGDMLQPASVQVRCAVSMIVGSSSQAVQGWGVGVGGYRASAVYRLDRFGAKSKTLRVWSVRVVLFGVDLSYLVGSQIPSFDPAH